DQHQLALAGADGIDDDEGAAGAGEVIALLRIDAQRLDRQQAVAGHRGDLLRRDHGAGDAGQEHYFASSNAFAWRATTNSSLVGMIHSWTRLSAAWMGASPFALSFFKRSRRMPNQSRLAHTASRMRDEFSPMPPVKTMASAPLSSSSQAPR